MVHAIEMGWFILNKYYALTDTVPAYTMAILLDPRLRAKYITKNWPSEWQQPAIARARVLWLRDYKRPLPDTAVDDEIDVDASQHQQPEKTGLGAYLQKLQAPLQPITYADDLDIFIYESPIDIGGQTPL